MQRFTPYPSPPPPSVPSSSECHRGVDRPCYIDEYCTKKSFVYPPPSSIHHEYISPSNPVYKSKTKEPVDLNNNHATTNGSKSPHYSPGGRISPQSNNDQSSPLPYGRQRSPFMDRRSPSYIDHRRSPYNERRSPIYLERRSPSAYELKHSPVSERFNKERTSPILETISPKDTSKVDSNTNTPAIEMLVRLFPRHQVSTLKSVLTDCNNDPVRAIEEILDKIPAEDNNNNNINHKELSPVKNTYSTKSNEQIDKKHGSNDDLSNLAKAFDIPVSEEKIRSPKIVHW